ncbi:glutamate-5-semialdehyde dehydrogenase [Sphingobacterium gobiense]|uniref:Gamma-glutamyl phosphate reductase n=1 Tax=Sphingobacterium gobiense TaxID=1382456 RepID=A0A2S9JHU5_9SPHI|nr:glutamate-5-semialdehyde dehydrogenase [Sphingobacterium gobiense]PRD52578.1 glutamate-5-semialdehyde dehydrogenase [Sphingobacterium gobiense]
MKKESIVEELKAAHEATIAAKRLSNDAKQQLLKAIANSLEAHVEDIIGENKKDLERMDKADPRYDRLLLDKDRILGLSASLIDIANLPDPTGLSISRKELENGLLVEKKTVPLGVVGVIYESRPNVTVDVAALCIRSGNVCVLRGGSDAWYTNSVLVEIIQEELRKHNLDIHIVQLLPTDRAFVSELLSATQYVDIIIPRGSQALIDLVRQQAKVPVIETGAGVCHTYVERSGDLEKAAKIIANAKIQRPSVCNALDTVLVDREVAQDLLGKVAPYFKESSVKIYADETAFSILQELGYPLLVLASDEDFGREFLSLQCSIRVVEGFDEALKHIAEHSSKHSECIVSTDAERVNTYMETVDAAAVYTNASTRFTDGAAFGLGAEIGISTQKLHARGPFALEKLVTEKWYVTGDGQVR